MDESGEDVIMLHGIWRTARHMRHAAAYLRRHGYNVHNVNYPSTSASLDVLIDHTLHHISHLITAHRRTHFVGYSMGGLMVRGMLHRWRPMHMGRAVLLAAPNGGSEVADWLQHNALYRKIYGPAGQQLITDPSARAHLMGAVDYPCGVIAGNLSLDPICAWFFHGPNDGKVSTASTKLEGMADHIVLRSGHTWFPHNTQVQRHMLHFLRHGMFAHESTPV